MKRLVLLICAVIAIALASVPSHAQGGGAGCQHCYLNTNNQSHYCKQTEGSNSQGCFCKASQSGCTFTGNKCCCSGPAPVICECSQFCSYGAMKVPVAKNDGTLEWIEVKPAQPTVANVKLEWIAKFKQDREGLVEVFHMNKNGCTNQEIFVVGLVQAATATGHAIKFTTSDDPTPEEVEQNQ